MKRFIKLAAVFGTAALSLGFLVSFVETRLKKEKQDKAAVHRPYGVYEKYFKRPIDFALSLTALLVLAPVLLVTGILVRLKLGSPVLFSQERPGKDGKIFKLYKFRSMTDARDDTGELLPDAKRLTPFGRKLRASSLDELPELFNIIRGDMAIVGPRPLLVEYLPRYSERQARRHEVRPGLTGLAQIKGRNSISWEEKFEDDVKYVDKVTFLSDCKIVLETILVVLEQRGITSDTSMTMEPFMGSKEEKL